MIQWYLDNRRIFSSIDADVVSILPFANVSEQSNVVLSLSLSVLSSLFPVYSEERGANFSGHLRRDVYPLSRRAESRAHSNSRNLYSNFSRIIVFDSYKTITLQVRLIHTLSALESWSIPSETFLSNLIRWVEPFSNGDGISQTENWSDPNGYRSIEDLLLSNEWSNFLKINSNFAKGVYRIFGWIVAMW